jgi:hypothetical protein
MKKVANYVIYQIRGKTQPRIYVPKDWLKSEDVEQYDTIKISFEVVDRYGKKKEKKED